MLPAKLQKIQGFTLIELLVVLAVLAIVAGAVVAAINPLQQINRANDGKVKNDIGQIATAMQSYFTVYQSYPAAATALSDLVASKDLTAAPTPPSGYSSYAVDAKPVGCSPSGTLCTSVAVSGELKAPKTSGNTKWCWQSGGTVASESASTCVAP